MCSSPKYQRLLHHSLKPAPTNLSFFPLDILSLLASHFTGVHRECTSRKDVAPARAGDAAPAKPAQARAGTCSSSARSSTSTEPPPPKKPKNQKTPEVSPTLGMREDKMIFFFSFFFFGLGVLFYISPQPLWSSPVYFFLPRCTPLQSVSLCVYHCRLG